MNQIGDVRIQSVYTILSFLSIAEYTFKTGNHLFWVIFSQTLVLKKGTMSANPSFIIPVGKGKALQYKQVFQTLSFCVLYLDYIRKYKMR